MARQWYAARRPGTWQPSRMSTTTPPKINRWTVFAEAIKSWPTTLRLALLGLAWSAPVALAAWLAYR